MTKKYWLMKTEPDVFSIDDLKKAPKQQTAWEGVRNYQARNFMRDQMQKGDLVFFYHSNANPSGIAGIARVVSETPYPDPTQFNPKSEYHDPKSTKQKPIWFLRDVEFVKKFPKVASLDDLRKHTELSDMVVLKKGSRLSIQPVSLSEWEFINKLFG